MPSGGVHLIMTTNRMISGEELKQRNGEGGFFGRAIRSA
jgi:hypothetical protein